MKFPCFPKLDRVRSATLFAFIVGVAAAISDTSAEDRYEVDEVGILRDVASGDEVSFFGVNYTTPFAHAFRAHNYLGIPHEESIDADVYHMSRLGLDAYRIHIWDGEITDEFGNLVYTEHMRLFDYLLSRLKERDIKIVITFMTLFNNGYPERPTDVDGFAKKFGYSKRRSILEPEAVEAQARYVGQLLDHVNPYTGVAYKDEPNIVGFELNNEPNNGGIPEETKAFINSMLESIRGVGCEKPVFYNVSQSPSVYDAVCSTDIQGVTFQWYPSGLVANHAQKGNLLPNVDKYHIPFLENPDFANKARIVYEFDAADVAGSYMYPAMARSFRGAGFQWATQFAYDPLYMAYANTEYQTHYLNLAYTPKKAISMKIASEVFHKVPRGKSFGRYPESMTFDDFRVSYEEDLSEMVTDEAFFYSNNTKTEPRNAKKLKRIAGYGNSPIISYEGRGAYFLDEVENGVWRLELMPDAIWVKDPFERASPKKEVAVIKWKSWPMTVDLPGLGKSFEVVPLNEGNAHAAQAEGGMFQAWPGAYLLKKRGIESSLTGKSKFGKIKLGEFKAPKASGESMYVLRESGETHEVGSPLGITAEIVSDKMPTKVELVTWSQGGRFGSRNRIEMNRKSGYTYEASVPAESLALGTFNYFIAVQAGEKTTTFPAGADGDPYDWDFYESGYVTNVVSQNTPLVVFDAANTGDRFVMPHFWGNIRFATRTELSENSGTERFVIEPDEMNAGHKDLTFGYAIGDLVDERNGAGNFTSVYMKASALHETKSVQVAFVMKNGDIFGRLVDLSKGDDVVQFDLAELKEVPLVTLPLQYPTFQPYWSEITGSGSSLDFSQVESIRISIGPGFNPEDFEKKHGLAIEKIWVK